MSLSIHIPQFEGPLGLLLYLIRKEEMDIFDIDVQLITSQYLEYIKKMRQFDLEVAGDFIAMAATLIQIKSKMLLPNYNEDGEEEEAVDPRKELVQRLLEYQRFQEASKQLYDRPLLGRDILCRGKTEAIVSDVEGDIIVDEGGLFALIAHYRNAVRKMKKAVHRVATKTRSIAGRILEIKDKLVVGQRVIMRDLIQTAEEVKQELLITFLSCLELGKMGYVSVYQSEVYGDIYLTAKREINRDVVGRVEEYDSHGAESLADTLMEDAEMEQLEMADQELNETVAETAGATEETNELDVASDDEIAMAEEELNLPDIEEEAPADSLEEQMAEVDAGIESLVALEIPTEGVEEGTQENQTENVIEDDTTSTDGELS